MLCAMALHNVPCHCAMFFLLWHCASCHGVFFVPWHCSVCRGFAFCLRAVALFLCHGIVRCAAALRDVLKHFAVCCSVAQCIAALRGVPKRGFLCGGTAIRVAALLFWCRGIVPCAFFCVLALWLVPRRCAWVPWCCASCRMLHVVPHHCPCPGCGHFFAVFTHPKK